MFGLKTKKKTRKLGLEDPVYSGRNTIGLWDYLIKHGSNIDNYFNGINISRERVLDENEWFDIHTTIKLWGNYRSCLPDFDMTETFQIAYESIRKSSYGIAKLVAQFSSMKMIIKLFPYLASTATKIDLFEILELDNTSAVIKYNTYPGFEKFIDSSHIFSCMGIFSALPTIHNMLPAKVREVASLIDVFKKFSIDFAQFGHTIEEKDEIIYLDREPAGRWITISKDLQLDPVVHKYLSSEKCVLWEKDVIEKKKAGNEVLIARNGDLYNCSKSIFIMEWKNSSFFSRIKGAFPILKQYLSAFFKSRDALFKQTSMLHDQANILQERIREKTQELNNAHEEIMELEKRSIEHRITGGFAHEMRNALAGAQLEVKSVVDYKNQGKTSPELLKDNAAILLKNLYRMHEEFDIPKEKIASYFIPQIKEIAEISDHLSEVVVDISKDIDRGLNITNEIRNYAKMHEFIPGDSLINISKLLKQYKYQYKKEFEQHDIKYSTSGINNAVMKADQEHLNSIFSNLILNAKDALTECQNVKGKIEINVEKDNTQLTIKVKDNGHGIPQDIIKEIFEPFVTTKPYSGTGLGLGIVRRLVNLYQGKIHVESEVGQGTTFVINFPGDKNGPIQ